MIGTDPVLAVADRFFLIGHDDRAGRRRLHPRALGLGLAGALLGELVLAECIDVRDGELSVVARYTPADEAVRAVLSYIMSSPHRDVRVWLAFLAESVAVRVVAARLERAGLVRVVQHRRLIGIRVEHVLVDGNAAPWQSIRLGLALNAGEQLWTADQLLVGLVAAAGLTSHVLWDHKASAVGLGYLPRVVESLSSPLREVVAHTEAAVGQLVLAPR